MLRVLLHTPTFGEDEIEAAVAVLRSTNVTQGARVREFEDAFAAMFGFKNAVACNSGSSANLLAVASLCALDRLKPGDEVIVSALSWSTTVWPLIQHGLVPVFVDCDPNTLNIGPVEVVKAMSERTRAVMPVHVYGNPCDLGALTSLCKAHGGLLIEDACEAMGAFYDGKAVGSFGHAGTFSFYFSHHITTLEGGMVVTTDDDLADMMRMQRSHGWTRDVRNPKWLEGTPGIDPRFMFATTGYNLRLTEDHAAIGLVQLRKLGIFVSQRLDNYVLYRERLDRYPWLCPQRDTPDSEGSYFGFPVVLRGAPFETADLTTQLNVQGIETRPIIAGNLALHPPLRRHAHRTVGDLAVATDILRNGFALPNHQGMGEAEVNYVCDAIDEFVA